MSDQFIIIIPARLNSSRLPNKALADLAGKPMIVRVAEQALKSQASDVIVATDNDLIKQVCEEHQIHAIMTSEHHLSGTDRLAEAAKLLDIKADTLIVNVQGDEPLINPNLINQLAQHLSIANVAMATVAHPIQELSDFHNPNVVKVVLDHTQRALYFSRSPIPFPRDSQAQALPQAIPAYRHIGMYAYQASFLKQYHTLKPSALELSESLEQLRVLEHGYSISVLISQETPLAGVDTLEDLLRVRQYYESHQ